MKAPNFDVAQEWHQMAVDGSQLFSLIGETDRGEAVWNALTGRPAPSGADTVLSDAVRVTMPTDIIPLLRTVGGIPAAFAFAAIAEFVPPNCTEDQEKRDAVTKAWAAFHERKKQANNITEGFGWDASPSWETVREVGEFGDMKHVQEIAKLAGKFAKYLNATDLKTVTDDPEEVTSTEVGGDPNRLLADEIARLFTPGMEDAEAIKILQKQANQYKMQGSAPGTRGPLVVVTDESASMHDSYTTSGPNDTGRNTWAKAALVALARIAHHGKRMVRVVHFGEATSVSECKPDDHRALLNATRHFMSGGTDISKALWRAIEQVGDLEKNGHKGADIVLITDGEDPQTDKINKALDECARQGIRLWTVLIEIDPGDKHPIVWRAEKVVRVSDPNDENAAKDFGEIGAAASSVEYSELRKRLAEVAGLVDAGLIKKEDLN